MLREHSDIDRHSHWSDVKRKVDSDARYKAVDSHGMREDWFREYCRILKEEKRRRKDEKEKSKAKEKRKKKDKDKKEVSLICSLGFVQVNRKNFLFLTNNLFVG